MFKNLDKSKILDSVACSRDLYFSYFVENKLNNNFPGDHRIGMKVAL